jgi:hypothetical protein
LTPHFSGSAAPRRTWSSVYGNPRRNFFRQVQMLLLSILVLASCRRDNIPPQQVSDTDWSPYIGYINHAWSQAIHHYLVAWNNSLGLGCNYHRAYKRQASQLKDNRASHEDAGRPGSISLLMYMLGACFFFVSRLKKYFFDEIS